MSAEHFNTKITRIIPGLKTTYELVSLPAWAWDSLEDYLSENGLKTVPEIIQDFADCMPENAPLSEVLQDIAAVHAHFRWQSVMNIKNDNDPFDTMQSQPLKIISAPAKRQIQPRAKAQILFKFLPHATTFDAVMHRQNPIEI